MHILLIKYYNIYYTYITRNELNIGIMTSLSLFVISVYTVSDITKLYKKKIYPSKSTIEQIKPSIYQNQAQRNTYYNF